MRALWIPAIVAFGAACAGAQAPTQPAPAAGAGKEPPPASLKPYDKVVTAAARTDSGVVHVHRVGDKVLLEVPDSLLGRDMLWLTRLSAAAEDLSPFLTAGSNLGEHLVRWERDGDHLLLRSYSFRYVADSTLPISRSVAANTFAPVLRRLKVEARSDDDAAVVADATGLFDDDIPALSGLPNALRTRFKVRRLDPDRSYLRSIRSFPLNLEARQVQTFEATEPPSQSSTGTISIEVAQSLVLLPAEPMRPRLADERVGWFTLSQVNFASTELKAATRRVLQRWRLEPSDPAAYARGELVRPVTPIVFYLDPATPAEWRPYIRQGIEDWQEAFEAAGFREAIVARDAPTPGEDPEFDPDDVRYSSVRYVANLTRNAMGPSVADPRTGEIIESDILWFHNHLRSYRNRLMIETGAANPSARTLHLDEAIIGEAVRQVIAHEIGHALGLPHNMIASSSFPVDSLRSPAFTAANGVAPSVMDYARQNYVAQPGDGVVRFIRQIGPYDRYAINWGYRVIPEAGTPEAERPILDGWIREHADDPRYRFGSATGLDPRAQTEDIGDDPVAASTLGIENLKRVLPRLPEWTASPGQSWEELEELYGELVGAWRRYTGHVVTVVGGVHATRKASDQAGPVYVPVPPARQRAAMDFLAAQVFMTPEWLVPPAVLRLIEPSGAMARVAAAQQGVLQGLFSDARLARLAEHAALDGAAYGAADMMRQARAGIWGELSSSGPIDVWRQQLQRAHLARLAELVARDDEDGGASMVALAGPVARAELAAIRAAAESRLQRGGDALTRAHLEDVVARIDEALDPLAGR